MDEAADRTVPFILAAGNRVDGRAVLQPREPHEREIAPASEADRPPDEAEPRTPLFLYVNAERPVKTPAELIALLKKEAGKQTYASGGSGSPQHLLGEMVKLQKDVFMVHIPYRGQGPAMQDVLGGTVPIAFETVTAL